MARKPVRAVPQLTRAETERFLSYVNKGSGPDDCWVWTGGVFNTGYGLFALRGENWGAHRVSYALHRGPTSEHLDHRCHKPEQCAGGPSCLHRRCVRPDHLAPSSTKENVLRGGGSSARNARKTHCKHGHEFTPENTGIGAGGERVCRRCARDKQAQYRQENREKILKRRREARQPVAHDPRPCPVCGEEFTPVRSTAKMCPACRVPGGEHRRAYMRDYMRKCRAPSSA